MIDQEDAKSFTGDEEITLINWGDAIVRKIYGTMNPSKKAVTSLELDLYLQGRLIDFGYLITKDELEEVDNIEDSLMSQTEFRTEVLADCNAATLVTGGMVHFERKEYFRVDQPFLDDKPQSCLRFLWVR